MKLLHFTIFLQVSLFSANSFAQASGNNTEPEVQRTLPGTGIAAVNSVNLLRIYSQDSSGGIREARFEGYWSGGLANDTVAKAKVYSSIAAASDDLELIRVYYLSPNNTLGEAASDSQSEWYTGSINSYNFQVASHSRLAAVFVPSSRSPRLRVYAQLWDNTIQEFGFDVGRGWQRLANFGPALPGTGIAALTYSTGLRKSTTRVYFQATDRHVVERVYEGQSWTDGGIVVRTAKPRTPLAATSFVLTPGNPQSVRVYYGTEDNRILEKGTEGGISWYDGAFEHSAIPDSQVAALDWGNGGVFNIRLYIQDGTFKNGISEWAWFRRSWRRGIVAIPPA
ncbi:L-fucose-specific lectin [Nannizzia gypsea CBS 118893]|uniref:Fucose-specific lectin n=1 Tax=Arthroderma gypseum (strain ATCC MYA-4604 / CBS 118893) TaxID=535722 RepID=E4UPE8_ARTGP|nr:L-fucose-specific lectin [Nannizzia gypsea CBS 118893]EFQ99037.1 L-fucose-specific lectin [Nannizzia gypsea CBS 118893]